MYAGTKKTAAIFWWGIISYNVVSDGDMASFSTG